MSDLVLVTGVSGFIGSHVALRLLEKGYAVRGTVRNKTKGEVVAEKIRAAAGPDADLELVEADLGQDAGWSDAVKGCRYIQHIASPFPTDTPSDREALVPEARAGAQRVLENGFSSGAERIVMTSSMAAMMGQPGRSRYMKVSENDWSDPDWRPMTAYPVSKTRAELSAWAYAKAQGLEKKLTVINPGLVLGPDPFENGGTSLKLILSMFRGGFPRVPKVAYPIIDIRDCASIHVAAMTAENAGGRRVMAAGETLWLADIAKILRKNYPDADKLPSGDLPNFIVRLGALFDDRIKGVLPDLGIFHEADSAYVATLTQVIPRSAKEAILASANSLIEQGLASAD